MAKTNPTTERAESRSDKARRLGPPTYDRLKSKKARTKTVDVILDDDLGEEVQRLTRLAADKRLQVAKVRGNKGSDPELEAELESLREELSAAEEALAAETITVRFKSIGRVKYEEILGQHPPRDKDIKEAEDAGHAKPEFNPETFPTALVGASAVEPRLDEGRFWDESTEAWRYPQAEEIFEEWNSGELGPLFMAAFEANTQRRVINAGNG